MGVLQIDKDTVWGSSKFLLNNLLESVAANTEDQKLKTSIELAITQNIAYYSIVDASLAVIGEFRRAVDREILFWNNKEPKSIYGEGAIKLFNDLKGKLEQF